MLSIFPLSFNINTVNLFDRFAMLCGYWDILESNILLSIIVWVFCKIFLLRFMMKRCFDFKIRIMLVVLEYSMRLWNFRPILISWELASFLLLYYLIQLVISTPRFLSRFIAWFMCRARCFEYGFQLSIISCWLMTSEFLYVILHDSFSLLWSNNCS